MSPHLRRFHARTTGEWPPLDHDTPMLRPQYACRNAWVKTRIHQHYTGG